MGVAKNTALCGVFFLILFAAAVTKLSPSLTADDSPETLTAQITLGIQHPPGYPLNSLAGKLFQLVPLGWPSFRANLIP